MDMNELDEISDEDLLREIRLSRLFGQMTPIEHESTLEPPVPVPVLEFPVDTP